MKTNLKFTDGTRFGACQWTHVWFANERILGIGDGRGILEITDGRKILDFTDEGRIIVLKIKTYKR